MITRWKPLLLLVLALLGFTIISAFQVDPHARILRPSKPLDVPLKETQNLNGYNDLVQKLETETQV
jgi:hypothetical protein